MKIKCLSTGSIWNVFSTAPPPPASPPLTPEFRLNSTFFQQDLLLACNWELLRCISSSLKLIWKMSTEWKVSIIKLNYWIVVIFNCSNWAAKYGWEVGDKVKPAERKAVISKFVRGLIRPFLSALCHGLSSYTSHIHSAKIVSVTNSVNSVHYLKNANSVYFVNSANSV